MSDQPSASPPPHRRRSSIVDLFSPRGGNNTNAVSSSPPSGSASSSNAPQHRRGMSITTMGLASSAPGQASPYDAFARQRRASIAASSASSSPDFKNSFGDDPVVVEDDENVKSPTGNHSGSFARRVSFGAQAMRDVKQGSGPGSPGAGEGFNWSESLRDRTKRSPSFSSSANPFAANANRARAPSSNAPEPPKELPKAAEPVPARKRKPDHLGERMLRGDFMMD